MVWKKKKKLLHDEDKFFYQRIPISIYFVIYMYISELITYVRYLMIPVYCYLYYLVRFFFYCVESNFADVH